MVMQLLRRFLLSILLGVAAIQAGPFISSVHAAAVSGSAIESPIGRFLLGETLEGAQLMSRLLDRPLGSATVDEFAAMMKKPEFATSRAEVEARLARVRESYRSAELAESSRFSESERMILRAAAKHELELDVSAGQIKFLNEVPRESFGSSEERFVGENSVLEEQLSKPVKAAEEASLAEQEAGKRSIKEWYKESQSCLQNQPKAATKRMEFRNLGQQLLISGGVSTAATFARVGITHVDLPTLGIDLMISFVSTGVSMSWMKATDGFQVRYLKVFSWGAVRPHLDAEIYRVSPWTDTHGVQMDKAVADRLAFGIEWNMKSSWTSPLLSTIINGAECLTDAGIAAEGTRAAKAIAFTAKNAFWIKTSVAVGNSILFQHYRNQHLPH